MAASGRDFSQLADELMGLLSSAPKDEEEGSCVAECADAAASCAEGCPPNDTQEGRRCVIACGRAGRKCIKACDDPPIPLLARIDALLDEMEALADAQEA